ncbi:hypothetical protein QQ008_11370 [Fulvivirgaceae bacterium BMA10]|uniref:Uncharacterized protein n=1 Tax=Splendidivirga corallicola TaxID=3051826 RepID=A0ABT8KMM9_9BACT|nr:hypothetical protein [Fulvivirgaceae bacterium BMA10]
MLRKLNWQAYTNGDRNKTIEEVKAIISNNDGCIMNFNMFSDLALSLSIEIEENKIPALHSTLSEILKVSGLKENVNPDSTKDWLIFINISFSSGKGELKREVPAVPG